MGGEQFLTTKDIKNNILKLKNFMKKHQLDSFYLSSKDIFLNEYVPLYDCHRYYFTQFTGSTAEVIVPLIGPVILLVDGRYFEQADAEVDPQLVEVYKCPFGESLFFSLKKIIEAKNLLDIGLEGDRIDLNFHRELEKLIKVKSFNDGELKAVVEFKTMPFNKVMKELSLEVVGESTLSKCQRLLNVGEAFFITALDSIAWLTNLRRHEMPSQSTFRAKALATHDKVYLLLEDFEGEVHSPEIEIVIGKFDQLDFFLEQVNDFESHLKKCFGLENNELKKVFYSNRTINSADFIKLKKQFGEKLVNKDEGLVLFQAIKNPSEIKTMEQAFNQADQAIFETISWVKEQVKNNVTISELDFYHQTQKFYQKNGASEQSFKTISAVGANSSMIHFSNPSDQLMIKPGELLLLDSGGFFNTGYATDTTRTFLSGAIPNAKQKEIYTLVLKAILQAMNAVFPEGQRGNFIDSVARAPMFHYGYNYNHGTGHGVGVNVHEGGFNLSPASNTPLKENTIGSIEPGIYIPGFAGVRLENVVVVEKHPTLTGMLCFRSLVFVGFDHQLIDETMLNDTEKIWLENYERKCESLGRSFKYSGGKGHQ